MPSSSDFPPKKRLGLPQPPGLPHPGQLPYRTQTTDALLHVQAGVVVAGASAASQEDATAQQGSKKRRARMAGAPGTNRVQWNLPHQPVNEKELVPPPFAQAPVNPSAVGFDQGKLEAITKNMEAAIASTAQYSGQKIDIAKVDHLDKVADWPSEVELCNNPAHWNERKPPAKQVITSPAAVAQMTDGTAIDTTQGSKANALNSFLSKLWGDKIAAINQHKGALQYLAENYDKLAPILGKDWPAHMVTLAETAVTAPDSLQKLQEYGNPLKKSWLQLREKKLVDLTLADKEFNALENVYALSQTSIDPDNGGLSPETTHLFKCVASNRPGKSLAELCRNRRVLTELEGGLSDQEISKIGDKSGGLAVLAKLAQCLPMLMKSNHFITLGLKTEDISRDLLLKNQDLGRIPFCIDFVNRRLCELPVCKESWVELTPLLSRYKHRNLNEEGLDQAFKNLKASLWEPRSQSSQALPE
jgi:hypothetical protein